jgi:hypothetical protein
MTTVILTALIFLFSNVPSIVYRVISTAGLVEEKDLALLSRIGKDYFPMISVFTNFFIYMYSVTSFNKFVKFLFRKPFCSYGRRNSVRPSEFVESGTRSAPE